MTVKKFCAWKAAGLGMVVNVEGRVTHLLSLISVQ
jgi:hypothetical protein